MSNRRLPSPSAPGGAFSDAVADLSDQGHLSPRQLRAAHTFLAELQRSHGASAGLVVTISERVDVSRREAQRPPGGASIAALDERLHRLRPWERELLKHLAVCGEKPGAALCAYGRARSGYDKQATARAFAVGRLAAVLEGLADQYFGPIRQEI
jgi:hypothetical protein